MKKLKHTFFNNKKIAFSDWSSVRLHFTDKETLIYLDVVSCNIQYESNSMNDVHWTYGMNHTVYDKVVN